MGECKSTDDDKGSVGLGELRRGLIVGKFFLAEAAVVCGPTSVHSGPFKAGILVQRRGLDRFKGHYPF